MSNEEGKFSRRWFVAGSGIGAAALMTGAQRIGSAQEGSATPAASPDAGELGHEHEEVFTAPATDTPVDPLREGWAGLAFVGGGESNKLWVVDARYHKLVTAIDAGGPYNERTDPKRYPNLHDVHAMVWTKDFGEFFTVNSWEYDQSYAIKYDPLTLREIGRAPAGVGGHHSALSPDDKYLYVANQYATTVSVIDRAAMTKVTDIEVGSGADYITPSMYWDGNVIDSPYLFVSADKVPAIVAIDWRTNEVAKTIPVSGANHGVNLTPNGNECWGAVGGGSEVIVIDTATLEVISTFKPIEGGSPIHVTFTPDSTFAFITIATETGLFLYKIDVKTREIVWRAPGSGAHLMISPDGKEAWTLNHTFEQGDRYPYLLGGQPLSAVRVFDTETGDWINEVIFERRPHEIQFVPYSAVGLPEPPKEEEAAVPVPEGARRITLTAVNDLFLPEQITAAPGELLQFEIINEDTYDHVFGTTDKRIVLETVIVPASKTTYVDWTAPEDPGEFVLICGIHPGMETLLIVE
jgi:YVTN family beta-propeller protein